MTQAKSRILFGTFIQNVFLIYASKILKNKEKNPAKTREKQNGYKRIIMILMLLSLKRSILGILEWEVVKMKNLCRECYYTKVDSVYFVNSVVSSNAVAFENVSGN